MKLLALILALLLGSCATYQEPELIYAGRNEMPAQSWSHAVQRCYFVYDTDLKWKCE